MQAGVLVALGYAAQHGSELLENFWAKGERAIRRGKNEKPYAWIFAMEQRDPSRLRYLVDRLLAHRIEVRTLAAPYEAKDTKYPAGSYVVRLDQPYRNAAIEFLDKQEFPADEPHPPYDDVGWTWPLLYGVAATRIDDPQVLGVAMSEPLTAASPVRSGIRGSGATFLLRDTGQTSLATARVLFGRNRVEAADTTFAAADTTFPAGSWIVRASRSEVESVARQLGLEFTAVERAPAVRRHAIDLPRLGVLHTWTATQDCGWVRYTLDQAKVPYTLIHDGDLERGGLRKRFDQILFPNTWGNLARIVHGIDPKFGPLAYTRTAEYPSHGFPDASPDITGGMGFAGLRELERFVHEGGVLVTLANAGTLAVDGGIARDVSRVPAGTAQTPGSELQAKVLRPEHPLVFGYEALPSVFRGSGPLWDVEERDRDLVVAQFGTKKVPEEDEPAIAAAGKGDAMTSMSGPSTAALGTPASASTPAAAQSPAVAAAPAADAAAKSEGKTDLVLSGFVKPQDKVDGLPAILDVPVGRGHVVLFAFNPMHRFLNHSDFRFVYNAILNWNDLPARPANAVATR
jgi:hypothetical protein